MKNYLLSLLVSLIVAPILFAVLWLCAYVVPAITIVSALFGGLQARVVGGKIRLRTRWSDDVTAHGG